MTNEIIEHQQNVVTFHLPCVVTRSKLFSTQSFNESKTSYYERFSPYMPSEFHEALKTFITDFHICVEDAQCFNTFSFYIENVNLDELQDISKLLIRMVQYVHECEIEPVEVLFDRYVLMKMSHTQKL